MCVVGMGLQFHAVLCGLSGSSVGGGITGAEERRGGGGVVGPTGLFHGGVVGGALSLALLCALVNI